MRKASVEARRHDVIKTDIERLLRRPNEDGPSSRTPELPNRLDLASGWTVAFFDVVAQIGIDRLPFGCV